jgi:hypothetical protein
MLTFNYLPQIMRSLAIYLPHNFILQNKHYNTQSICVTKFILIFLQIKLKCP